LDRLSKPTQIPVSAHHNEIKAHIMLAMKNTGKTCRFMQSLAWPVAFDAKFLDIIVEENPASVGFFSRFLFSRRGIVCRLHARYTLSG